MPHRANVRILADYEGVFAPELQHDGRQRLRGSRHDLLADNGGPDKDDLVTP